MAEAGLRWARERSRRMIHAISHSVTNAPTALPMKKLKAQIGDAEKQANSDIEPNKSS